MLTGIKVENFAEGLGADSTLIHPCILHKQDPFHWWKLEKRYDVVSLTNNNRKSTFLLIRFGHQDVLELGWEHLMWKKKESGETQRLVKFLIYPQCGQKVNLMESDYRTVQVFGNLMEVMMMEVVMESLNALFVTSNFIQEQL